MRCRSAAMPECAFAQEAGSTGRKRGQLPKQQSSALHGSSVSPRGLGEEGLRTRALPGHHLLSFVTLSSQAATHLLPHLGTAAVPFLADSTDNSELVSPSPSSQATSRLSHGSLVPKSSSLSSHPGTDHV